MYNNALGPCWGVIAHPDHPDPIARFKRAHKGEQGRLGEEGEEVCHRPKCRSAVTLFVGAAERDLRPLPGTPAV